MRRVHYFQRYSQKENVVTNNTLLLFSRINSHDSRLFEDVLVALIGEDVLRADECFAVGAQFSQQDGSSGGSVPDGIIRQPSFRIVLETKLHSGFWRPQLEGHLKSFAGEDTRILLLLSPDRVDAEVRGSREAGVHVISRTFADVLDACKQAKLRDDRELVDIIDDFEEFMHESGLVSGRHDRIMTLAVGASFQDNLDFRLYYAPSSRGYQEADYIGLYTNKAVRAIGKIENIVCADLVGEGPHGLKIAEKLVEPTPEQLRHIRDAIDAAPKYSWDLRLGHRFFLVKCFVGTEFSKASPGGLRGKRYFSIRRELSLPPTAKIPPLQEICEQLKSRTWE